MDDFRRKLFGRAVLLFSLIMAILPITIFFSGRVLSAHIQQDLASIVLLWYGCASLILTVSLTILQKKKLYEIPLVIGFSLLTVGLTLLIF